MDNSPSWDQPLSTVPQATHVHIERRDVATVSAKQRPSTREYRQYLGIVEALRAAGWDTERQPADSPFAVEDPSFTAITARAAADLAGAADQAGLDASQPSRLAERARAGLEALWDDEVGWFRPYDTAKPKANRPGDLDRPGCPLRRCRQEPTAPHDGPARHVDPIPGQRDTNHRP